jgi:hypothetical protein
MTWRRQLQRRVAQRRISYVPNCDWHRRAARYRQRVAVRLRQKLQQVGQGREAVCPT